MNIKYFGLLFLLLFAFNAYSHEAKDQNNDEIKVLVGVPVRRTPIILSEFLLSLKNLEKDNLLVDYYFIDDNEDPKSSQLLKDFIKDQGHKNVLISAPKLVNDPPFICDESSHHWKEETIWKVAAFKDMIIEHARVKNYDYLFLIDSDILLFPQTLKQLIKTNKAIISNIWWTRWSPTSIEEPNVWLCDQYSQYIKKPNEQVSEEEGNNRMYAFFDRLRQPGTYEVGGLCGCTLISKTALQKGVKFAKIKNLTTLWGEDRYFCVRAAAMGISLHVDTHYPAYHVFRESLLAGVDEFKRSCGTAKQTSSLPKRKSDTALHVVTVASSEDVPNLDKLKESCKLHKINLKILGLGQGEPGFGTRLLKVKEYAKTLKDDDVLLYVDSSDVLILADKNEILEKFFRMNQPIVMSAARVCSPEDVEHLYPPYTAPYRYLNVGAYIGVARDIKKWLKDFSIDPIEDDQYQVAHHYFSKPENRNFFILDRNCDLFLTLAQVDEKDILIDPNAKSITLLTTGGNPIAIHAFGDYWAIWNKIYQQTIQPKDTLPLLQ